MDRSEIIAESIPELVLKFRALPTQSSPLGGCQLIRVEDKRYPEAMFARCEGMCQNRRLKCDEHPGLIQTKNGIRLQCYCWPKVDSVDD